MTHTVSLGRFGPKVEWLEQSNYKIKLNIPSSNKKEQPWIFRENIQDFKGDIKPFVIKDELGIEPKTLEELTIFKESGLAPGMAASPYWTAKLRKLAYKKTKYKSSLDTNMYLGIVRPSQEIFTLHESRTDRNILVFDLKSAYPSIIQNKLFPSPDSLFYVERKDVQTFWFSNEYIGLFRVNIKLKENVPAWFKKYNPLFYTEQSFSSPFDLKDNTTICTWMHNVEREVWGKFLEIEPIDAICGIAEEHPLKHITNILLDKRINTTDVLENAQLKWLLSRTHSASVPKLLKTVGPTIAEEWFKKLGITSMQKHNHIPLEDDFWMIPDVYNPNVVYTWSATISAYMRTKWLEFLDTLYQLEESIQLCYANIDSLHISIPIDKIETLVSKLENIGELTNEAGKWALTHRSATGLWLAIDKYWLSTNGKLVKNTKLGEYWKTKDKINMFKNGKFRRFNKSLWKSLTSKKITIQSTRGCILQNRHKLATLIDKKAYTAAWNLETLRSRNWKKKIWYKMREYHAKEKECYEPTTIGVT